MNLTNFYLIDDSEGKLCLNCHEVKPLSEFGINRALKDGHNTYCRFCIRAKTNRKRTIMRFQRRLERKPCKPIQVIWKMKLPPHEKVYLAIQRGARTQREIKRMTRLLPDLICDALASLWDTGKLDRDALKRREYRLCA